jgi:endonuclease III
MGSLTLELVHHRPPSARHARWKRIFSDVADHLVAHYGPHFLGNYRDPVEEIIYILLSARTNEIQYQAANRALREAFPRLCDLAAAREDAVRSLIAPCGLEFRKARQLKEVAKRLLALGEDPSRTMREMEPEDLYHVLMELPGVGPKSALCVLMYSIGLDVFPVDAHAIRVMARIGVGRDRLRAETAQKVLPAYIPNGRCKDLHVGFVLHGRKVCRARRPECDVCVIRKLCRTGRGEKSQNRTRSKARWSRGPAGTSQN